jgi:hypothetical protein
LNDLSLKNFIYRIVRWHDQITFYYGALETAGKYLWLARTAVAITCVEG